MQKDTVKERVSYGLTERDEEGKRQSSRDTKREKVCYKEKKKDGFRENAGGK